MPQQDELIQQAAEEIPASLSSSGPSALLGRTITGHLEGVDDEGQILFRAAGESEIVPVTIGIALPDGSIVKAARLGQRALVVRTDGEAPEHVLIGLLRNHVHAQARDAGPGELQVEVDGETLKLSAAKKIALKCGKSSLTLHENGKVVLSGSYVVSRSKGPNKIKGATIALN